MTGEPEARINPPLSPTLTEHRYNRRPPLLRFGSRRFPYTAEAVDVVPETDIGRTGAFVVAISGAAILGAEFERAATKHHLLAFVRPSGILAVRLLIVVRLVVVVAPLPNVANYVVESPWIRLLLSDGPGMPTRV